ncbi:MAG TPA: shikimate dehydrogenase [Candidatus Dormibacteraeota bacterium]
MPREVWLLGGEASTSLSPAMQNAAFSATGLELRYEAHQISADELASSIAAMRRRDDVLGANVTIPHKQAVIPLLDELDPLARRLGAVNTISRRDGRLVGSNTDVHGFARALDECGYAVDRETVTIFGAGGAARAAAHALRDRCRRIIIIARDGDKARRLVDDLELGNAVISTAHHQGAINRAAVIVNATPIDVPGWTPRPGQRLFDLRYRRSQEGRSMLLHQGAAAFEIWTGHKPPVDVMREALRRAIQAVPA